MMSADNWATCPQCLSTAIREYELRKAAIEAAYGKVSIEEFESQRAALGEVPTRGAMEPTLREDYELGIDMKGKFEVEYYAGCSQCRFAHTFKTTETIAFAEKR